MDTTYVEQTDEPGMVKIPGGSKTPGSGSWSKKIRKEAKELAQNLESGYMELARILYQVFDTPVDGDPKNPPIYTQWGYKKFADYAETELNLHRRKAEHLRRIWYKLEIELADMDKGLKDRIVKLGWSKVRELVRAINLVNAEEWVTLAEDSSYPELIHAISKASQNMEAKRQENAVNDSGDEDSDPADFSPPVDEPAPKPENFALYPEQHEVVKDALKRAEELSNSPVKSNNLALICTDFLATNSFGSEGDRDSKLRMVAKLENQLGLKFVVVDPETREVIYGIETLEMVAASEE